MMMNDVICEVMRQLKINYYHSCDLTRVAFAGLSNGFVYMIIINISKLKR